MVQLGTLWLAYLRIFTSPALLDLSLPSAKNLDAYFLYINFLGKGSRSMIWLTLHLTLASPDETAFGVDEAVYNLDSSV